MKRILVLGACLPAFLAIFSISRAAGLPDTADLIIYNAKVLTVNSNFTIASAIAVKDGRILAVGKDRKLEEYRGPETRMVDAQGKTIMPGLYDGDESSFSAAMSELKEKQPVINSIADAQAYIRKQATNKPPGAWIELDFVPPTRLTEGRMPTKDELDAATTNHPVCWSFGPMVVVNSKALEVSRIDKDTQAPPGGEIVLDSKHHKPTGLLRNAASVLKLPKPDLAPTIAQERAALKKLYQLYNEQGITSIGEDATTPTSIDLFRDLSSSNELTVRINCARYFRPSADADESIDRLGALTNAPAGKLPYGPTGVGDDWVRIGPLQTVIDGTADMGTAYLRTPYGIGPTYMNSELAYRGVIKQDAFALPQVYLAAAQNGWQLEAHCSGDAALDFLLNSYEEVQFKLDIHQRRFLIAHPEFQAAQDWSRCEKLGVGAIVEPTCLYEDGTVLEKTLGTNRLTHYMPFKGWFNRGIVAGGASAHFIGMDSLNTPRSWNPWLGMWITLTRETKQGGEINPQEKLTREQAVRFYTYNNAWLHSEDNVKGSLEPGKLADLVMLDTDIMKCPVDDIRNTKVLFTMVGGKVVWQAVEPIFPGPQVIPAVTINVPNQPVNVVTPLPVAPAVAKSQPTSQPAAAVATVKHTAEPSTSFNPFAPVADAAAAPAPVVAAPVAATPAPINVIAPLPVAPAAAAAAPIAATVQPAPATTSQENVPTTTASAPVVSAMPAAPASSSAPVPAAVAINPDAPLGSIAGAAPAESAQGQQPAQAAITPAATSTAVTNSAPSTITNQAPGTISTNAANSVLAPDQATASVTTAPAPAAAQPPVTVAMAPTPNATTTSTVDTSSASANQPAATATTSKAPAPTPATPAPATPATAPAPAAAAGTTPDTSATTSTTPPATVPSTTSSTAITNDAPGSQDWSRVLSPSGK